jgi:YesN/AraC family two-component response regulator
MTPTVGSEGLLSQLSMNLEVVGEAADGRLAVEPAEPWPPDGS